MVEPLQALDIGKTTPIIIKDEDDETIHILLVDCINVQLNFEDSVCEFLPCRN